MTAAFAKEVSPLVETISIGTSIGMAVLILLAVVIALSVVAKLLVVSGIVPRNARTRGDRVIHGLADVVGGLRVTRASPIRRRGGTGGGGSFGGGASGRTGP